MLAYFSYKEKNMYTIYSAPGCTFCEQAKSLLKNKGLQFKELVLDVGQLKAEGTAYISRDEFKAKLPNVRTVPQIFLGESKIGGFDDLKKSLA